MVLSNEEHLPIETAPIIWFVFDKMYSVVYLCQIYREVFLCTAECFYQRSVLECQNNTHLLSNLKQNLILYWNSWSHMRE